MCWGWHLSIHPESHSCQVFLHGSQGSDASSAVTWIILKSRAETKHGIVGSKGWIRRPLGAPPLLPFNLISKQHSCNSLQVTLNSCSFSARLKPSPLILNNLQARRKQSRSKARLHLYQKPTGSCCHLLPNISEAQEFKPYLALWALLIQYFVRSFWEDVFGFYHEAVPCKLQLFWLNSGEAAASVVTQSCGTAPKAYENKVGLVQISPLCILGAQWSPQTQNEAGRWTKRIKTSFVPRWEIVIVPEFLIPAALE